MEDETLPLALTLGGIVLGLAVMVVGVMQNAGQALNVPMVVGGVVVLAAIGVLTGWGLSLEPA
jgi:hypothetical protein